MTGVPINTGTFGHRKEMQGEDSDVRMEAGPWGPPEPETQGRPSDGGRRDRGPARPRAGTADNLSFAVPFGGTNLQKSRLLRKPDLCSK